MGARGKNGDSPDERLAATPGLSQAAGPGIVVDHVDLGQAFHYTVSLGQPRIDDQAIAVWNAWLQPQVSKKSSDRWSSPRIPTLV
jgi:hypothetical protein